MIQIRLAGRDDADALCDAHVAGWRVGYRGLFPDEYLDADAFDSDRRVNWRVARWLDAPAEAMFAAVLDNNVRGFAHAGAERVPEQVPAGPPSRRGEVFGFYLHPSAWGTGLAAPLMSAAEEWLRGQDFDEAVLWVLRDNPRARGFYEKAGWTFGGAETMWAGPQMPGVAKPDPVAEVQYVRRL